MAPPRRSWGTSISGKKDVNADHIAHAGRNIESQQVAITGSSKKDKPLLPEHPLISRPCMKPGQKGKTGSPKDKQVVDF
jgi:hypothetical protein